MTNWTDDVVRTLIANRVPASTSLDDNTEGDGVRVNFGPARKMGRIVHLNGVYTAAFWEDGRWHTRKLTSMDDVVDVGLDSMLGG